MRTLGAAPLGVGSVPGVGRRGGRPSQLPPGFPLVTFLPRSGGSSVGEGGPSWREVLSCHSLLSVLGPDDRRWQRPVRSIPLLEWVPLEGSELPIPGSIQVELYDGGVGFAGGIIPGSVAAWGDVNILSNPKVPASLKELEVPQK